MKGNLFFLLSLAIFSTSTAFAQKGSPPKKTTHATVVTKYPQQLDFLPAMVKMLKVPAGWEVSIAASGLGKPRMMYIGPNGELYITRRDGGDVLMLKDKDGDNKFEELTTVVADFKGVHGITIKDGYLYLCNNKELRRYKLNTDGTTAKEGEVLIDDMPNGGQHSNRTMEFGPDGMLYLSIGSTCNDCKEGDKEMASIVQIDPSTWKRKLFASGLRNTIGFDFHPTTKEIWGIDNGCDYKGNKWPPEEVNHIVKDGVYGFPFAYGKNDIDQTREDPAGDTKEEFVKNAIPSILELPAHSAPIGFRFFGNVANIPADFADDGLVCWHGSWNRNHPSGFKVQRVIFENGNAIGVEDFLTGFLKGKTRFGRPAGVAISKQGVVYVSDDANGVLYAVKKTK